MRYYVTLDGHIFEVDLQPSRIVIDGETLAAELTAIPATPLRRLALQDRSHLLHVGRANAKGQWEFCLDGESYSAEVVDQRTRAMRAMTGATTAALGPKPVRAPMPGLVIRVEVAPGDRVVAGQGVVIIEAMKMENELKAEAAGVVSKVLTEAGAAVDKGTVLIEFSAQGEGEEISREANG